MKRRKPMAKATKTLPSKSVTRRHILAGAVTTAAASVAGAAVSQSAMATPHAVAPTADGRRLLQLIAALRDAYAGLWVNGDPTPETQAVVDDAHFAIDDLGREITALPAKTVADIVDRAILAAYASDGEGGRFFPESEDLHGFKEAHLRAVLSLAGISPAQCNAGM
jgi:hypothetical protein